MFGNQSDLGAALFATWSEEQRRDEIQKLVVGFRSGVPLGILCKMSETIAGSKKKAKSHLKQIMSQEERTAAIASAEGAMLSIAKSFLQ